MVNVFFAHVGGTRQDVVCFRDMAGFIISERWYDERLKNKEQEYQRIVTTAAKLIREEIRAHDYTKDEYPNAEDIHSIEKARSFLTPCLLTFIVTLMSIDLKRVGIGHVIAQGVRPKSVMSPILFGLGVEMDNVFGSEWLIDQLSSLGFSSSYTEISLFNHSIIQDKTASSLESQSDFVQYAADNTDVNIATIDGSGTFHGMGVIRWKKRVSSLPQSHVKRTTRMNVDDLVHDRGIRINECAISKRIDVDIQKYMSHEMCTIPPALFKDGFMRKADKADLAQVIQKDMGNCISHELDPQPIVVVDGGWLLHRVRWRKSLTYEEIVNEYSSYLERQFGHTTVVFDGYEECNTKDHEHSRRTASKTSATVSPRPDMKSHDKQDAFLNNAKNKTEFIKMLGQHLQQRNHSIHISKGDADTMIVNKVISFARNSQSMTVVAEDTDIFVMLLHHWGDGMAQVYLRREGRKGKQEAVKLYNIQEACEHITPAQKKYTLFIHAWSGCDTTSACYGQGKVQFFKTLSKSLEVQNLAQIISSRTSTESEIGDAGVRLFCFVFDGDVNQDLSYLRYIRLQRMIAICSKLEPQKLPPTCRAAHFHALRVHLQISAWSELADVLNPLEFGWQKIKTGLQPIQTDLPPAPPEILQYVRCKYKSATNRCRTNLCSCKKNGLRCVEACGGCRGEDCENREPVDIGDDREDDSF